VTTTRVDATILSWTKEDTSPSLLGGASKIVRYATSTSRSSYLSMHELSFFDEYFIFYNSTSASPAMQDITSVIRSIYMIGKRMLQKKLNLRRNMVSFLMLRSLMNQKSHFLVVQIGKHCVRHMHLRRICK
jgi:hypothetical protein